MDDDNFISAMDSLRYFQKVTEEGFAAVEEEFYSLKSQAQLLQEKNMQLNEEIDHRTKSDADLESAFMEIKAELAEAQQVFGQTENITRAAATRGRRGQTPVYHEMMDFFRNLSHENIALREKLRRERELLAETKQAAAESATHHQKVTTDSMTKLNSLQTRREIFYDEQCASEWRKLQQDLNVWTRATFKDKTLLRRMAVQTLKKNTLAVIPTEYILQDIHGKRAYIQGVISGIIFDAVFGCSFAFSPSTRLERFLKVAGSFIRESDSSSTWETWRTATSKALGSRAVGSHQRLIDAFNQLLQTVESLFGEYYSPSASKIDIRNCLMDFFRDCLGFKHKLEQQESDYYFQRSPTAAVYSPEHMNSLNFKDETGSTVQISIWPSLRKVSFDNEELLIEPEAVWTKEPVHVDTTALEHHLNADKKIKQEQATDGDDEDLCLLGL